MAKARRTTHRSSAGKKLYAVRAADGTFKDIQTYERAHRADLARGSKAEGAAKIAVVTDEPEKYQDVKLVDDDGKVRVSD